MHVQEVAQEVLAPQEVKVLCFCGSPVKIFRDHSVITDHARDHGCDHSFKRDHALGLA